MAIEDDDLLVETTVVEPTEVSRPGVRRTQVSSLRSPVLGGRYQITTRPTSSRFPLSADRDVTHVRDATIEADDPPPSSARRRLAEGSSSGLYRIWAPADAGGAREVSIRRARPPSEDEVSAITDFLSRNKRR